MGLNGCVLSCTGLTAFGIGASSCSLLFLAAANSWDYGHFIQSFMEKQKRGGEVSIAFHSMLGVKNHLPLPFQLCSSTTCLFKRKEPQKIKINVVTFKYLLIPSTQNPPAWRNCWFYFSCSFKWKITIFTVNTGLSELSVLFLFWMVLEILVEKHITTQNPAQGLEDLSSRYPW